MPSPLSLAGASRVEGLLTGAGEGVWAPGMGRKPPYPSWSKAARDSTQKPSEAPGPAVPKSAHPIDSGTQSVQMYQGGRKAGPSGTSRHLDWRSRAHSLTSDNSSGDALGEVSWRPRRGECACVGRRPEATASATCLQRKLQLRGQERVG